MMRLVSLVIMLLAATNIYAQNTKSLDTKSTYKRLFVSTCMEEAKKQKIDVDVRGFCNCSFEKFYTRAEESGADFEADPAVLDKISQSPEYEKEVQICLLENVNKDEMASLFEKEFMNGCIKSINKDKFMRKNADANEICECSLVKIKDGKYSLLELGTLTETQSEEYIKKISEECMKYYLDKRGIIIE